MSTHQLTPPKAPWHLWAVGIVALLWNAAGAITIVAAQQGMLTEMSQSETAYYAAQAPWFVIVTDIALLGGIAGSLALLLRSKLAVPLFAISLVAIAITNGYDLIAGTSQMFNNAGTVITTVLIWILAVLQLLYAGTMKKRTVLR